MMRDETMQRGLLAVALLLSPLALAATAAAEPRTHDGLYAHLDGGFGYLAAWTTGGAWDTASGISSSAAVLIGSTVDRVVIGGGLFVDHAHSPSFFMERGGETFSSEGSLDMFCIGVFADIYPDAQRGLHFQAFIGPGLLTHSHQFDDISGVIGHWGLLLALGAGYDWWVGDEWSIGLIARAAYAQVPIFQEDARFIDPGLLATITYH